MRAPALLLLSSWQTGCTILDREDVSMTHLRKLVTKIDPRHWILLSQDSEGSWRFRLGDVQPLEGRLGCVDEEEAKRKVLSIAARHWQGFGVYVDSTLQTSWRVAVRLLAS